MDKEDIDYFDVGKRISIEIGTQMQIQIEGFASRVKGILVGIETNEYLIIKLPYTSIDWQLLKTKLFKGNQIIVRYLHKGTIFGFQSTVLDVIFTPAKLIFAKYPSIIEEHNIRAYKRVNCFLPAKIKVDEVENEGSIQDISQAGCRYVTKNIKRLSSLETDKQITITFQFPGVEGSHNLSGKIKNIKKDSDEIGIGIEFVEITPEIQTKITEYIQEFQDF
jgi:c-di-GMP-binding flagellar brake protein YcgR